MSFSIYHWNENNVKNIPIISELFSFRADLSYLAKNFKQLLQRERHHIFTPHPLWVVKHTPWDWWLGTSGSYLMPGRTQAVYTVSTAKES